MKFRTSTALALILCWSSIAAASPVQTTDPAFRDSVITKDGKLTQGRILERYHPDHVLLYRKTKAVKIKHSEIQEINTLRDDLERFMAGHRPGMTLKEEWRRVQEAIGLDLMNMARVQAWKVLTLDPQHGPANQFLGHSSVRGKYRWPLGRKKFEPEKFAEEIRDFRRNFQLESEHYVLETNTTIGQAVNILFDLEFVYLYWMKNFGEELQAGEDVYLPYQKMTFYVFHDMLDKGFTQILNLRREAFYDPSNATTTNRTGNPNVAFSYYREGTGVRPVDMFNVAIQQLMYSTLVLSRRGNFVPTTEYATPAHWVELGMGYWLGRQFGGPAGYARHQRFVADSYNRELATRRLRSGPLAAGHIRREVTNLVNLGRRFYYNVSKANTNEVYRAKARSFFRYLMEADPPLVRNGKVLGHGREGLMRYLREIYPVPTDHSSKSLDNALGGKVELLFEGWVNWRK